MQAILAAKILATSDDALLQKVKKIIQPDRKEAVKAKAAKLDEVGYEAYLASK